MIFRNKIHQHGSSNLRMSENAHRKEGDRGWGANLLKKFSCLGASLRGARALPTPRPAARVAPGVREASESPPFAPAPAPGEPHRKSDPERRATLGTIGGGQGGFRLRIERAGGRDAEAAGGRARVLGRAGSSGGG